MHSPDDLMYVVMTRSDQHCYIYIFFFHNLKQNFMIHIKSLDYLVFKNVIPFKKLDSTEMSLPKTILGTCIYIWIHCLIWGYA